MWLSLYMSELKYICTVCTFLSHLSKSRNGMWKQALTYNNHFRWKPCSPCILQCNPLVAIMRKPENVIIITDYSFYLDWILQAWSSRNWLLQVAHWCKWYRYKWIVLYLKLGIQTSFWHSHYQRPKNKFIAYLAQFFFRETLVALNVLCRASLSHLCCCNALVTTP